nr:hypothetical protein BaRGS_020639 [Batillaria attramentaria]
MSEPATVQFSKHQKLGKVKDLRLDEASGLAASRKHPGVFYTHNDKGGRARIFALSAETGEVLATLKIEGAVNKDWEDICVGPSASGKGDDQDYIYVGDIGDRGGEKKAANTIYKVREPDTIQNDSLKVEDTLKFKWREQDAESLMIDPEGNLYIISKVKGGQALFAKLPASGWGASDPEPIPESDTARLNIETNKNDPQGADISPDGTEILVKAEKAVYYYAVPKKDYLKVVRDTEPQKVETYKRRKDGEAVAWKADGSGFYTLPEGENPTFHFYRKL